MSSLESMLATLKMLALYKFPYSGEFGTVNRSILGCLAAADRQKTKPMPWLQDIVFTILTTFGGALVAPVLVGEPPVIFANELLLPVFLVVWLLVVQAGDTPLTRLLRITWVKRILTTAAAASTANSICSLVEKGAKKFTKGSLLYPTPLVGPWLVGVIRGSAAAFLPLDKGLSALNSGLPWSIELAAITAAFYHIAANDPFVLGATLRGLLAPLLRLCCALDSSAAASSSAADDVTPLQVRLIVITVYVSTAFMRTFPAFANVNVFEPAHRVLTAVTGVGATDAKAGSGNGAPPAAAGNAAAAAELAARRKKERTFDVLRFGAAVAVIAAFLVNRALPPDSLAVGQKLSPGGLYLGKCTFLPELRGCTPYVATVAPDGSLQVVRGKSPSDPSKTVAWTSPSPRKVSGAAYATLHADGRLAVVDDGKALWQSGGGSGGNARRPPNAPYHAVLRADGTLAVVEGGADLWTSS